MTGISDNAKIIVITDNQRVQPRTGTDTCHYVNHVRSQELSESERRKKRSPQPDSEANAATFLSV